MTRQELIEGWKKLFAAIPLRQRITIGATAILVVAGILVSSWWKKERDFKPLYTGMAAEDAGLVVDKLKEAAVEYRLGDNGATVLVPSERVSETRLMMASAGLPKTGRIGFELFDKTNLGATDFAEQVNYRRALEGELERSIRSVAEVETARVHLTFPKDSVFLENKTPAKASVLLKLKPTVRLTAQNVVAVTHLVASAVEGLAPEAVSVLDIHGNLLSRPQGGNETSEAAIEYRQKVERDLLNKVNSTLEPLLGADKFRVGISVDCDFTSGEQSEESFDPEKTVMVNSQKTEETSVAATAGGIPGTASNLPRPPARTGSSGGVNRRTETIAYQSSKMVRRLQLPQGSIKRVSAAVLLDQEVRWEGKSGNLKRVLVPPSAESLRAIREVIAGTIGFVPTRGDQLVIETLPFESTLQKQAPVNPVAQPGKGPANNPFGLPPNVNPLYLGIGAGVAALAGLAIVILLKRRKKKVKATTATALPGPSDASADGSSLIEEGRSTPALEGDRIEIPKLAATRTQTLVDEITLSVSDDATLAARVLRSWLEETKRHA